MRVGPELVGDERLQVHRGHLLLLVRDLLEALERLVERVAGDLVAQVHQRRLQRVAAGVLAEHDRVRVVEADGLRGHDLVGRALLEHAVLVDAGLVLERVAPHDGLVRLDDVAGQTAHQPAGACDLARVDAGDETDIALARAQQHHDFLERRVAGALADPVDRTLDLARAGLDPGEGVRDGQPQIVVAVDRQHDVAQARDELVQAGQERRVLQRHRVADRVRDVDRGRTLLERGGDHLGGELDVGAGGVHRAELDVLDQRARVRDRRARLPEHVLARGLQLVGDVDVAGRDERVHARAVGVADGLGGTFDVGGVGAGQAGDDRAVHLAGDRAYRLEVTRGRDRESSLDHVHAEARQLLGDLQLLVRVQRDARRLLAVSQRRVEDDDPVGVHGTAPFLNLSCFFSGVSSRLAAAHALVPPRGEEKKKGEAAERHECRERSSCAAFTAWAYRCQVYMPGTYAASLSRPAGRRAGAWL